MTAQEEKGYRKLGAWKSAHELVLLIYKHTRDFPRNEEYGITSQIRRAALSVAANIVEGQASSSKREFVNFLNMANRSLVETEYFMEAARDLNYMSPQVYDDIEKVRRCAGAILTGLIRSVRSKL